MMHITRLVSWNVWLRIERGYRGAFEFHYSLCLLAFSSLIYVMNLGEASIRRNFYIFVEFSLCSLFLNQRLIEMMPVNVFPPPCL